MCGLDVVPGQCSIAGQVSWVNNNGLCGKNVEVQLDNGRTFTAQIRDGCPDGECAPNHLDLSGGCWINGGLDPARGVVPIKFRVL